MKTQNNTLFHMFLNTHEKYQTKIAFIYRVAGETFEVTYGKFFEDVLVLSRSFASRGIKKGSKVMFVCDNRYGWMVTDMALVSLGAISIPRGSDTPTRELQFIMKDSDSQFLIVENEIVYHEH